MAMVYWTGGGGTGVVSTGANWSSGSVPGVGDTVIIGATGYNLTGTLSNAIASLLINPGHTGGIDITVNAAITAAVYAGSGPYFRLSSNDTITALDLTHGPNQTVDLVSGTYTLVTNGNGTFNVLSNAVLTAINNALGRGFIDYNATGVTTLSSGGVITMSRAITTGTIHATGELTTDDSGLTSLAEGTMVVNGKWHKKSSGNSTSITVYPGATFSMRGNKGGADAAVTITAIAEWFGSSVDMIAVPGVTITDSGHTYIGKSAQQAGGRSGA